MVTWSRDGRDWRDSFPGGRRLVHLTGDYMMMKQSSIFGHFNDDHRWLTNISIPMDDVLVMMLTMNDYDEPYM